MDQQLVTWIWIGTWSVTQGTHCSSLRVSMSQEGMTIIGWELFQSQNQVPMTRTTRLTPGCGNPVAPPRRQACESP
jgi:hypothetical protein